MLILRTFISFLWNSGRRSLVYGQPKYPKLNFFRRKIRNFRGKKFCFDNFCKVFLEKNFLKKNLIFGMKIFGMKDVYFLIFLGKDCFCFNFACFWLNLLTLNAILTILKLTIRNGLDLQKFCQLKAKLLG